MGATADRRRKFLLGLLGTGVAAVSRDAELEAVSDRSVHEGDQLRAARGVTRLVHDLAAEFARNGVRRVGGDLAALAWWPDAARIADLSLRLMSYTAAGELPVESINPDLFDLGDIDFGTLDLRRFRPEEYLT
jgi:hypothetical protein